MTAALSRHAFIARVYPESGSAWQPIGEVWNLE